MITVLVGANDFLIKEALQEITTAHRRTNGDSIERFDANEVEDVDTLIHSLRSISFLDPRKLLLIKGIDQQATILERLRDLLEACADTTDLVVTAQKLNKQPTILLKEYGATITEYSRPSSQALQQWVQTVAKEQGATLSAREATYLIEQIGEDQHRLYQEVLKLALAGDIITHELIDTLVEPTPQSKIFTLLEALFSGNLARTTSLYDDQRKQGVEPQKIFAMIVWQLEQLALVVFAKDRSIDALTGLGLSPYSARKLLTLSKTIDQRKLKQYISDLVAIDMASKTNADIESALVVYFASVAKG